MHLHVESNIKVFVTREHNIFKSIMGNRLLNHGKIKKIIKEIESGLNMLEFYPIVVDKDMNVIDGQHRLFIARQLKCNIWYIICERKKNSSGASPITLNDIAKINSNTERWKNKDFLHCYAAQKNDNYIKLSDFCLTWGFDITTSMTLLSGKAIDGSGGVDKSVFETGQFIVKDIDYANKIARQVHEFKKFPNYNKRAFVVAIAKLVDAGKCDMDELKKKFLKNPENLTAQASAKAYLKVLEEVYNFHRHKREVIW